MAYFQDSTDVVGQFQEKEYKMYFEYVPAEPESWGETFGFPFKIVVGSLGETRYAKVYKTVAYVVVNEDEYGNPVIEKWQIKHIWKK